METTIHKHELKTQNPLRNEQGLTLIELLAVIVILAIIAAIAIPSIGGIINNTKQESHRSNAHMIVDAARFAVTTEDFPLKVEGLATAPVNAANGRFPTAAGNHAEGASTVMTVTLAQLVEKGYLERIPLNPENSTQTYDGDSTVAIHRLANGKFRYQIDLEVGGAEMFSTPNLAANAANTGVINEEQIDTAEVL